MFPLPNGSQLKKGTTRVLGAILAGGRAVRFGSDKATAIINGETLIGRITRLLREQVEDIVVCGRQYGHHVSIQDLPCPGLGPLGGLAAALEYARLNGYDLLLTTGCDLPILPPGLVERLAPAPDVVEGQPLLGLWPAELGPQLLEHLAKTEDRSIRLWLEGSKARRVTIGTDLPNINTPADLAAYLKASDAARGV